MKAEIGEVVGCWTEDVLNPGPDGGSYKYHLCVDSHAGFYLYVCTSGFPFDFELPKHRCPGLTQQMSYVSLSRVIHRSTIPKKHRLLCRVSDDFLLSYWNFFQGQNHCPK